MSAQAWPLASSHPVIRVGLWLVVASSSIVWVEPAPADVLVVGLLVLTVAYGLPRPRGLAAPVILLITYLIATGVASALAPDVGLSVRPFAIRTYLVFAWFLVVCCLVWRQSLRLGNLVWNAYLVSALFTAIVAVSVGFGLVPDFAEIMQQGRVRAFFKDPNVYGPFLVPPTLYAISRFGDSGAAITRAGYAIALTLLLVAILIGFSRGSWLNLAVALVVLAFLKLRCLPTWRERIQRVLSIVAIATTLGMIAIFGVISDDSMREMFERRATIVQEYDLQTEYLGKKSRMEAQAETLKIVLAHPLGIGAGQSESDFYQARAPHNLYLHVLAEAGWIGGIAFITFLLITMRRGAHVLAREGRANEFLQLAFASLTGILAQSVFIDTTHWRHFYLLLGLIWGAILAFESGRDGSAARWPQRRYRVPISS